MTLEHIKLNKEEHTFYINHLNTNPKDLIFKKDKVDFSYKKIAIQLEARNRCLKKLPRWTQNTNIVYPQKLSLEQCSSEQTALFKQSLLPKGSHFIDITGGFGVDTAFLSKNYTQNTYCELNQELASIVQHNFTQLQCSIQVHHTNGVEYILNNTTNYDLIYLDPARRKADKKVFRLEDCTPNLIKHQDDLLNKTTYLFSKHSPLLDINHLQQTLKHIKHIYVVSVANECKEILVIQDKGYTDQPILFAVHLKANQTSDIYKSEFNLRHSNCAVSDDVLQYIYIPNSSLLKAGLSEKIALEFQLNKFSANTHFYLSNTFYKDYPGRCFEITAVENKVKSFKKIISKQKRDVICRNSTYKPDELAKKLNLVRGNDNLFVLSGKNNNQTTYFFDSKRIF